jgi:hypothetical protein
MQMTRDSFGNDMTLCRGVRACSAHARKYACSDAYVRLVVSLVDHDECVHSGGSKKLRMLLIGWIWRKW